MTEAANRTFPALRIRKDKFVAEGAFAEAQAGYLDPDPTAVAQLTEKLKATGAGIVAHYYMDPELQGVLTASDAPHIHISDSLQMADRAVRMAAAGVNAIFVLGVDFMSENVRAVLDEAGHRDVSVYRLSENAIGCTLAESAEQPAYETFLKQAAETPRSLHVIYINTSLATKAQAQALVPSITCTSSNVLKTLLQAAHQVDDLQLWYGPDTYMGRNLEALLHSLVALGDDAIRAIHPDHNRESVASLAKRFRTFEQGVCLVHHMFGSDVAARVREEEQDAYVTAHLEVPGAMFSLALEKSKTGQGVVGSTSNILSFITDTVRTQGNSKPLRFVLGTEAGMVTSIVRQVREVMTPEADVTIVFPVASEAISATDDSELPIVPGVLGGEGCSVEGGCATCPYMKMNSLDALLRLLDQTLTSTVPDAYRAARRDGGGRGGGGDLVGLGTKPITAMRHFQETGSLSETLVQDIIGRRD